MQISFLENFRLYGMYIYSMCVMLCSRDATIWIIALLGLLQYMIKELISYFTVKATLVETCVYSYGYKRYSHFCSVVIRYLQL